MTTTTTTNGQQERKPALTIAMMFGSSHPLKLDPKPTMDNSSDEILRSWYMGDFA
jgi:hypothetical protein